MGHYGWSSIDNRYSHLQRILRDFDWCIEDLTRHYIATLKATSSWYWRKSKATIGVKNTASYTPWLCTSWDQMVALNMIYYVFVLMTITITQVFCIKFMLVDYFKANHSHIKKASLLFWRLWRTVQKLQELHGFMFR